VEAEQDYDYEAILHRYHEHYSQRAKQAIVGSVEQKTYEAIARLLARKTTETPKQRAFHLVLTLMTFAQSASQVEARAIYRQCCLDLNRDTGQEPLSL